MAEWITEGISRKGLVEISKNPIKEYKRVRKVMEVWML
jgi:hypothetical protein